MKEMLLSLGLYDDPSNQKQDRYQVDLYTSNLAIFGSAMTGKTSLLKWILLNIHYLVKNTDEEEIYILDFSNNLSEFKRLPFVMGYFDSFNEENIRRVFKVVEEQYINNVRALPGKNFLQRDESKRVKHITFILDGIHVLFADDRYQKYQERLFALARDGLSKGISVVFTATEPVRGIGRMLSSFDHKIAFAINPDSYSNIFFRKVDIPMNKPGRGVVNGDGTFVYEFQAFLPYDISNKDNTDYIIIEQMSSRLSLPEYIGTDGVKNLLDRHLESIADTLSEKNWNEYVKGIKGWKISEGQRIGKAGHLVAGIDYYLCTPIDINLEDAKTIAIYGKKDSGKTNLLKLILRGLLMSQQNNVSIRIVYWDDNRKSLKDPNSGIGTILQKFSDTKEIKDEVEFVSYLKTEHYCDLEEVEEEKEHTAKLIALPSQKTIEDEGESSTILEIEEPVPLSDGDEEELNEESLEELPEEELNEEPLEELPEEELNEEPLEELPEEELNEEPLEEEQPKEELREEALEELLAVSKENETRDYSNGIEIYEDSDEDGSDIKTIFESGEFDEKAIPSVTEKNTLEDPDLNDLAKIMSEKKSNTVNNNSLQSIVNNNPFTVFIIQSRSFFVKAVDAQSHIITRLVNYISDCENVLFVFSDTQPIQDYEVRSYFNTNIRYAFLFDDIVKYIQGKGARSIFSEYDIDELKENFGRNEKGDAFFYDVLFGSIQKIKVILDE